jgi:N-formylglutamate amidohydrolase
MRRDAAFEILPGAADSPVILHVPHASRHVPSAVRRRLLLDDAELEAELDRMTDADTDVVAMRAAAAAAQTPWLFVNRASRLVVDPERFPDEREEMVAVGMGAVYTRTSHGEPLRHNDPAHVEELLATYYRPYAKAMTDLVEDRLVATGRALILDVHSYPTVALPYELHGEGPRPAVCLGTDAAHTPPDLIDRARQAFAGCGDVALDSPFSGCYVPLAHYRRHAAVTALMLELRRDIVATAMDDVVEALAALSGRRWAGTGC